MEKSISLICKRCKYGWCYKGKKSPDSKFPEYVSCPHCRSLIKINNKKE